MNCGPKNNKPFFHLSALIDDYAFPFRNAAKDKKTLKAHHITHVLNAADGKLNSNTGPSYYRDTKITYHGVEAFDMPSFNLSPFFYPAANFIKNALSSPTGEELSPCSRYFSSFLGYTLTRRRHFFFVCARQSTETFVSQFPLQQPPVVLVIKMQIKH